jgi:hypothetical protein
MNAKRIIVAGLVSGLFIDIAEGGLSHFIIGNQFLSEVNALGIHTQMTPGAAVFFISWGFVIGLVLAFLYAGTRKTLGPGPKTALRVAGVVWLAHGLLPHLKDAFLGVFSFELSLEFALLQFIWLAFASLLAGWLYRETSPAK